MRSSSYSPVHRVVEISAVAAVAVLSLFLLVRLCLAMQSSHLWLVGVAAVTGYVAADLISGLVHWICDTWGSPRTPVIGRSFIAPFREHHHDPESITRHDFIETNGNTAVAIGPVLVLACFIPPDAGAGVFGLAFVLFASLGVLATNQIHKWAHMDRRPRLVHCWSACG
ncbi:hypothetical protein BH23ACI1_BH23ACI1_17710 [soil metagenome]|nr:hypothetical protein [Acidobacteriota bacterium]